MAGNPNIAALLRAKLLREMANPQAGLDGAPLLPGPIGQGGPPGGAMPGGMPGRGPGMPGAQAGPPGGAMPGGMGSRGPARAPMGQGGVPGGAMPGGMPNYAPPAAPQAPPPAQAAPPAPPPGVATTTADALRMASQGPQSGLGSKMDLSKLTAADMQALAGGLPAQEEFDQGSRLGDQADLLRASSKDMPEGRMIGRVYVPASIAQYGAKVMEAFVSKQKEDQQKEERAAARKSQSSMLADWAREQFGGPDETDRAMITPAAGRSGR